MSRKIKISKKECNALAEIRDHINGCIYENGFEDEMKEAGQIEFDDYELSETLNGLIKKWIEVKKS